MAFLAGAPVTADSLNDATTVIESTTDATAGTTTSTSYTDTLTGPSAHSLAFTTPESGIIVVTITSEAYNSGANYATCSFRISGAAGTVASSDNNSLYHYGSDRFRASSTSRVSGLTPGAAGTVTLQHKVVAGTGTFNRRKIKIEYVV